MPKTPRKTASAKPTAAARKPAKKAATPKKAKKAAAPPQPAPLPADPLDEALMETFPASDPIAVDAVAARDTSEPRVPIKDRSLWGTIRQLIQGWNK